MIIIIVINVITVIIIIIMANYIISISKQDTCPRLGNMPLLKAMVKRLATSYYGGLVTPYGVMHCITINSNNNMTWWRHQMETFSALLALCAGY